MKTDLYYFTGTGNSLAVAKDLAEELDGARVCSIPHYMETGGATNADCIGVIFPVYFSGLPLLVADFLDQVQVRQDAYLFAVCTCGGIPAGTLLQAQRRLAVRGLTLQAGFSIRMPGNYIVKYSAFPAAIQRWLLKKEKKKIQAIAEAVRGRREGKVAGSMAVINRLTAGTYEKMVPRLPAMDGNFRVDDRCRGCGLCRDVCPVANIALADGKPRWLGRCQHCLACLQWCPAEAIEYGDRTVGRKRYHHPEISVKDLLQERR